jgi:hypothetical protein
MPAASISHDTANPLMPLSNRISELVNAEPCTNAIAVPLRRTLSSLHQYLHATDPEEKRKHESNYAADSSRLMTNLRTCLESLKNTSKEKFDSLMNFFIAFGESLPRFIKFLKTPEAAPDLEIREAQAQSYQHVLSNIVEFGKSKQDFPSSIILDFKYAKAHGDDDEASFTVRNPQLLFKYLELASRRNILVNNTSDHKIKMYFILAQAIKQKLEKPNEHLTYSSIQDHFGLDNKLVNKNIREASSQWEKRHQTKSFTGTAYAQINAGEANEISRKLKAKFPLEVVIPKLELLPTYVNLTNRLESILPSPQSNETSRLEHLLNWYLSFEKYNHKHEFLSSIGNHDRALAPAVNFWNSHFTA